MKKLFVCLLFSIALVGCSSDENGIVNIEEKIEQNLFPVELKSIEDLPEMLVEYIWDYRKTKEPIELKNDAIYQFSWKGETYYFHNRPYTLVWFEYVFNSKGSRIDLMPEERLDIKKNSKGWKLVYRINDYSKTEIQ